MLHHTSPAGSLLTPQHAQQHFTHTRIQKWKGARLPRLYVLWSEKERKEKLLGLRAQNHMLKEYCNIHLVPDPDSCWKSSRFNLEHQLFPRVPKQTQILRSVNTLEFTTFPGSPVQLSIGIKTTALPPPLRFLIFHRLI